MTTLHEMKERQQVRRGLAKRLKLAWVDEQGRIIGYPNLLLDDLDGCLLALIYTLPDEWLASVVPSDMVEVNAHNSQ